MTMNIADIFENFSFFKYPLLVGILLCLASSVIGVILVLKRYSMIGDGLSHVSFGVIAVALCLNLAPSMSILIAIPIVILCAYILLRIGESTRIKGDSIIGLMSSSSLAIAYIVLNVTGTNIDINSYLFGSILFATKEDFLLILPISILVIVLFVLFYNRIFSVTFDESFATATGIHSKVYNILIAVSAAVIIVIGMKLMGTLLISSLIIFPALSSMRVFNKFKAVCISSAIISIAAFLIAFFGFPNLPNGAAVVIVNLFIFFVCAVIHWIYKYSKKA